MRAKVKDFGLSITTLWQLLVEDSIMTPIFLGSMYHIVDLFKLTIIGLVVIVVNNDNLLPTTPFWLSLSTTAHFLSLWLDLRFGLKVWKSWLDESWWMEMFCQYLYFDIFAKKFSLSWHFDDTFQCTCIKIEKNIHFWQMFHFIDIHLWVRNIGAPT